MRRRDEQLQLLVMDLASREESLVAKEARVDKELGSIPAWEQNLAEWSHKLGYRD